MASSVPASHARGLGLVDALLLMSLGTMWGCSFLFIKLALAGLTPMWIVVGRTLVGAVMLVLALALRGRRLPRSPRMWGHLFVLGLLSNAVPWGAVAWAQQAIPTGLAALLMALVPTSTLVVASIVGLERITALRATGLLLALGGVAVTAAVDLDDPGRLSAIATIVVATLLYGCGAVYAKQKVSGTETPLAIAAGQLVGSFVVVIPLALLLEPVPGAAALDPSVLAAAVALGVFGTGLAFLVFYTLIERVGATNTTLVTYLIPVVAVIVGAIVLGERLGLPALMGGAMIVAGIWLAQRGTRATTIQQLEELPK